MSNESSYSPYRLWAAARLPNDGTYFLQKFSIFGSNLLWQWLRKRAIDFSPSSSQRGLLLDALEEYVYDFGAGHLDRGGNPNVALFEWYQPDASIELNYGDT